MKNCYSVCRGYNMLTVSHSSGYCYMHNHIHAIKTSEVFFKKNIPLTLFITFACERELETEQNWNILTPTLMAISVVSFSFSWYSNGGPGAHSAGFLYCILSPSGLVPKLHRGSWEPFCWLVAFPTTSCLQLVWSPTQSGVSRAPSTRRWFSLPHLISDFSGPQLTGGPEGPFGLVRLSLPHLISNSSGPQLADFLSSPSYIIVQLPTQSLEWHVWLSSSGNNCHAVQRSLSSGASVYECIMGFYLVPFHQPNPPTQFLSITGHWNVSLLSGASLWNRMFGRV